MTAPSDDSSSDDDVVVDVKSLRKCSAFLSDSSTEEDKSSDSENAVGPPIVLELTPIMASVSLQDEDETAETSTSSTGMVERYGSRQSNTPLTPIRRPWIPELPSSIYCQQAAPIPVLNGHSNNLLEISPIMPRSSAEANNTNSVTTSTTSTGNGARRRVPGQLVTPPRTPWLNTDLGQSYGQPSRVGPIRHPTRRRPDMNALRMNSALAQNNITMEISRPSYGRGRGLITALNVPFRPWANAVPGNFSGQPAFPHHGTAPQHTVTMATATPEDDLEACRMAEPRRITDPVGVSLTPPNTPRISASGNAIGLETRPTFSTQLAASFPSFPPLRRPNMPALSVSLNNQPSLPRPGLNGIRRSVPVMASSSAPPQDNLNTSRTGARRRLTGPLDNSLTPPNTPWISAPSGENYGQQDLSVPVRSIADRRRNRRRATSQHIGVDTSALSRDNNDETPGNEAREGEASDETPNDEAQANDPRFVLPGAIREREEIEEEQIAEASGSTNALRSEFVVELLMSTLSRRISRDDLEKIAELFGTKTKKK